MVPIFTKVILKVRKYNTYVNHTVVRIQQCWAMHGRTGRIAAFRKTVAGHCVCSVVLHYLVHALEIECVRYSGSTIFGSHTKVESR